WKSVSNGPSSIGSSVCQTRPGRSTGAADRETAWTSHAPGACRMTLPATNPPAPVMSNRFAIDPGFPGLHRVNEGRGGSERGAGGNQQAEQDKRHEDRRQPVALPHSHESPKLAQDAPVLSDQRRELFGAARRRIDR